MHDWLTKKVPLIVGYALVFVGFLVIFGWLLDVPILRSLSPNFVSMKFNTAVAFVILGMSFIFFVEKKLIIAKVGASLVLLIGFLTFSEYVFGVNLGIDELIIKDVPSAVLTAVPGRMAIITAINFFLLGLTLLIIDKYKKIGDSIATFIFFSSWLAVLGYLQDIKEFYRIGGVSITAIALHTSVAFIIISFGILLHNADNGLFRIFVNQRRSGRILRSSVLGVSLLAIIISQLLHDAAIIGIFSFEFVNALLVIFIALSSSLILFTTINKFGDQEIIQVEKDVKIDNERKKYDKAILAEKEKLQKVVSDLEKMNQQMVGREMKMIELKKEISRLKNDLANK